MTLARACLAFSHSGFSAGLLVVVESVGFVLSVAVEEAGELYCCDLEI